MLMYAYDLRKVIVRTLGNLQIQVSQSRGCGVSNLILDLISNRNYIWYWTTILNDTAHKFYYKQLNHISHELSAIRHNINVTIIAILMRVIK